MLDAALPDDGAWRALAEIKRNWQQVGMLIVAHTFDDECRARAGGADATLLAGFPAALLWDAIAQVRRRKRAPE